MLLPDNKKPQPTSVSPVKPQRKGTGFTNLARVMQASQGSKLGQTIAGGLTGQAQQVQSGIKTAQEEFEKEAGRNRIDTEINRGRVTSAIGNIINPTTSGSPTSGPSSEDLSLFNTIRSAEYKGPTELANQQQLQAQARQAQTLGSLASGVGQRSGTDQGGRQELLRRFAGGSDYTSGQRKLDESILSKDKESNLASAARQTRGVAEEAQRAATGAQAKGQEYGKLAGLFAKETDTKLKDAARPISSELDARVAAAVVKSQQRDKFITDIGTKLKSNEWRDLTPTQKASELKSLLSKAGPKNDLNPEGANLLSSEQVDSILGGQGMLASGDEILNQISGIAQRGWRNDEFSNYKDNTWDQLMARDRAKGAGALFADTSSGFGAGQGLTLRNQVLDIQKQLTDQDRYSDVLTSLTDIKDQNLNRQGFVSPEERAKFNALDQLMGRVSTDSEFSQLGSAYKQGELKFAGQNKSNLDLAEKKLQLAKLKHQGLSSFLDEEIERNRLGQVGNRGDAARAAQARIDSALIELNATQSQYDQQLARLKKEEDEQLMAKV